MKDLLKLALIVTIALVLLGVIGTKDPVEEYRKSVKELPSVTNDPSFGKGKTILEQGRR